jgi:hypothetical protein
MASYDRALYRGAFKGAITDYATIGAYILYERPDRSPVNRHQHEGESVQRHTRQIRAPTACRTDSAAA